MRKFTFLIGLVSIGCGLGACASPPVDAVPANALQAQSAKGREAMASQGIMVRFRQAASEAEARAILPAINAQLGADLLYVRPMSGNMHLLRPSATLDASAFDALLRRLSALPSVEFAEPDRLITLQ